MDGDARSGRFSPLHMEEGERPAAGAMSRGVRMLTSLGCGVVVLLVLVLVLSIWSIAGSLSAKALVQSTSDRVMGLMGIVRAHAGHRYDFVRFYDSGSRTRVVDARALLDGLPSGAPLSVLKGWVELVFASEGDSAPDASAVSYNVTVVHPDPAVTHGATALQLVVLQFSMKSADPTQKAAVTLCGAATGVPCAAANTLAARKDTYAGAGTLPANFDTVATADALHTTFLLLVYMGNSTTAAALAPEDIKFVVELEQ